MLTQAQVGRILNVGMRTLRRYFESCRSELSADSRHSRGRSFTEADVTVLRRFQDRLTSERALVVSCAWCGRDLGIRPGGGVSGNSHGMCQSCADAFISQYELDRPVYAA